MCPPCREDCSINSTWFPQMAYERSGKEGFSESDAPDEPGQDVLSDTSEKNTTEDISGTVSLRRSTRQKRLPRIAICVMLRLEKGVTSMCSNA